LTYQFAIGFFAENDYKDTFSFVEFSPTYSKDKLFKEIEKSTKGLSPEQYFNFWYNIRDGVWKFPESSTLGDIYIYDSGI